MRWTAMVAVAGVVGVMTAVGGAGCAAKKGPQPLPVVAAASDEQLSAVREAYRKADPGARVGRVVAVIPAERLAAVADFTDADLKEGDVVTFVDGEQRVLTSGSVVRVVEGGTAHVKYAEPAADRRAPVVGDLGVRLSSRVPANQ